MQCQLSTYAKTNLTLFPPQLFGSFKFSPSPLGLIFLLWRLMMTLKLFNDHQVAFNNPIRGFLNFQGGRGLGGKPQVILKERKNFGNRHAVLPSYRGNQKICSVSGKYPQRSSEVTRVLPVSIWNEEARQHFKDKRKKRI